jgi:hypothetical protein
VRGEKSESAVRRAEEADQLKDVIKRLRNEIIIKENANINLRSSLKYTNLSEFESQIKFHWEEASTLRR